MLKKTITYTDYNGMERTEDFYFNLSKAELTEIEMTTEGGFTELVNRIVASVDIPEIFKLFKEIVLKSYGVKDADGKRFIKSEQIRNDFLYTEAFSVLLMELCTDAEAASNFVNGVIQGTKTNKPVEGQ